MHTGRAVVAPTPSSIVVLVMMDLFHHRYYRLNKTLMTLIGQWPYQNTHARPSFVAVLIFVVIGQIIPQILVLIKYRNDWKIVLDSFIPFIADAVCATKLFGFMRNSQKTLQLLNRIRTDWRVWAQEREVNILHKYTEQGKMMTIVYTAAVCLNVFVYMTQPLITKVIGDLMKNGTEHGIFPFPVDYYRLDAHKYYYYIIVYSYVYAYMVTMVSISSDVMLIIYVQHVCGIFAALGHKLKRIVNNDTIRVKGDTIHLASCIDRHNGAIEYANLIEAVYTWTFFFIIGLGVIMINAIGLQILLRTSNPEETIRFVIFALTVELNFFVECYISQILIDHSFNIRFYIYSSQWYKLSSKAQQLLQFMIMRCSTSCQLTAGKMLNLSIKTFALAARTAFSYFTLVRSTQGL